MQPFLKYSFSTELLAYFFQMVKDDLIFCAIIFRVNQLYVEPNRGNEQDRAKRSPLERTLTMLHDNEFADRTPTAQELAEALEKAHILRSRAFRGGVKAGFQFLGRFIPTGGASLTQNRIALR